MGSALNPAKPETIAFLDRLFGELASLFSDRYFHVGGAPKSSITSRLQGFSACAIPSKA